MMKADDELLLTSENAPSEDDVRAVYEGLVAFNMRHVGLDPKPGSINLFVRDDAGRVVGGLLGGWHWGWLYINRLWVSDDYRKRGAGSRLLRAAEAEAVEARCTDAVLETFSFQARGFYERHGYQVYATLRGFPPGYEQYFCHKRLVEP